MFSNRKFTEKFSEVLYSNKKILNKNIAKFWIKILPNLYLHKIYNFLLISVTIIP